MKRGNKHVCGYYRDNCVTYTEDEAAAGHRQIHGVCARLGDDGVDDRVVGDMQDALTRHHGREVPVPLPGVEHEAVVDVHGGRGLDARILVLRQPVGEIRTHALHARVACCLAGLKSSKRVTS